MLDTNIFNRVVEGLLSVTQLEGSKLIATRVQYEELKKTPSQGKREKLLACFTELAEIVPGASFCFGVPGAGWGEAQWNDGTGRFRQMQRRLEKLDKRKNRTTNQLSDIVIAETALVRRATLISDDANLRTVLNEFGGCAITSDKII